MGWSIRPWNPLAWSRHSLLELGKGYVFKARFSLWLHSLHYLAVVLITVDGLVLMSILHIPNKCISDKAAAEDMLLILI